MTASQKRSVKIKEKKRKKQSGAKGTPAAQPPPIRPTPNPDSMAERKESTASEEETLEPEHEATLDQVGESSIAEDNIAATTAASAAAPMDDTNSQTSESSHTSTYFFDEKLRWAYAQLERCLERREGPPAWLLQLVMPETHHEQDRFEQYENKMAIMKTTIASLSSSLDNLKRARTPVTTPNREHSSTPARRQQKKTPRSSNNINNNNNRNNNRNSSNTNDNASTAVVVDNPCNYPKCKYPDSHTGENCGLRAAHIRHGFEKHSR